MTKFIKAIKVKDGYNGDTKIVYLCKEISSKQVWAVWEQGSYRWGINSESSLMYLQHDCHLT